MKHQATISIQHELMLPHLISGNELCQLLSRFHWYPWITRIKVMWRSFIHNKTSITNKTFQVLLYTFSKSTLLKGIWSLTCYIPPKQLTKDSTISYNNIFINQTFARHLPEQAYKQQDQQLPSMKLNQNWVYQLRHPRYYLLPLPSLQPPLPSKPHHIELQNNLAETPKTQ